MAESSDAADMVMAPEVQSLLRAVAYRVGIHDGIGLFSADDVLSELGLIALRAALVFRPESGHKFTTYLWPRLRGRALDLLRLHTRVTRYGGTRPTYVPITCEDAMALSDGGDGNAPILANLLARLPARERAALIMRDLGGLSPADVSLRMNLRRDASQELRRRAVRRLRVALRP
ncbi:MAG: hypothetical protein A2V88_08800 [Elusimicrobia bacterium RBG_16_66_12]|nr:MAG: hypothetical protein A2V88_08800 [Elusimicrobia bacterium RBG_16_66_12]